MWALWALLAPLAMHTVFGARAAYAQESVAPQQASSDSQEQAETPTAGPDGGRARVYQPAYFDRFAPRSALDMVERIPGFTISGDDRGGNDSQRGFGQASQNVLINGRRLSSKTDSARDQLGRIPAKNVTRIEIVDGTALDIPGLSGQVANVFVTKSALAGQFEYRLGLRAHNADAEWYGGEISIKGSLGGLDYTFALENPNRRFGADGPTLISDAVGDAIELQQSQTSGGFDQPKLSAQISYDFGRDVIANFHASGERSWFFNDTVETGMPVSGSERVQHFSRRGGGPEYELSGDISFPLGPSALKLIALANYDEGNSTSTLIDRFADGSPDSGSRFSSKRKSTERIGRFEVNWPLWGGDWQLSGEAAFNRLDRTSQLFDLAPNGQFTEVAFPQGSGGVNEDRYESILSLSKPLSSHISIQASLGGEISKIEQSGSAANSRRFARPKGSFSASWKPSDDFDLTIELARKVGQLSFNDFLASVELNNNNQNGGNNELVPEQSWNLLAVVNKDLGAFGSINLELERRWISDYVDFLPLAGGGEARGNLPGARLTRIELASTFKFDPLGLKGAQLDLEFERQASRLPDPLTGENRPFSRLEYFRFEAEFRHDLPNSDFAYGLDARRERDEPYFRSAEIGREGERPWFVGAFIEHKDVLGMTLKARLVNIIGARNFFERTVYDGPRNQSPVLFVEQSSKRIGLIARLTLSGNF